MLHDTPIPMVNQRYICIGDTVLSQQSGQATVYSKFRVLNLAICQQNISDSLLGI